MGTSTIIGSAAEAAATVMARRRAVSRTGRWAPLGPPDGSGLWTRGAPEPDPLRLLLRRAVEGA